MPAAARKALTNAQNALGGMTSDTSAALQDTTAVLFLPETINADSEPPTASSASSRKYGGAKT